MRNFKAIGLAALMALALSAMFASAASAETPSALTGGVTPIDENVTLRGTQEGTEEDNFFEAAGGKVTCANEGVEFTGTVGKAGGKTVTVEPHYKQCTFSGLPTTVHVNECDYTFLQPTNLGNGTYTSEAELYCPENKSITVEVFLSHTAHTKNEPFAVFHIRPHNGNEEKLGGHVVFTPDDNGNDPDDITVNATITKVPYVLTPDTKATDGVYRNTVTLTGWGDEGGSTHNEQRDLWFHDEG